MIKHLKALMLLLSFLALSHCSILNRKASSDSNGVSISASKSSDTDTDEVPEEEEEEPQDSDDSGNGTDRHWMHPGGLSPPYVNNPPHGSFPLHYPQNPGHELSWGIHACKDWCRDHAGRPFCCHGSNMPVPRCPGKRIECPFFHDRSHYPSYCDHHVQCQRPLLCCEDVCLPRRVCKPPVFKAYPRPLWTNQLIYNRNI